MELYQVTSNDIKHNLINLHQIVFENCEFCHIVNRYFQKNDTTVELK